MYKKLVLVFILSIILIPITALADCDKYSIAECESKGCKLVSNSDGTSKCVYNNISTNKSASCGNNLLTEIPATIPKLTHMVYNIIQVLVPILLVLFCSIDLIKAVAAGKEDDIKKNQNIVIKRLITAILVFFVFFVVKFVISLAATDKDSNKGYRIINCAECFINNRCG